ERRHPYDRGSVPGRSELTVNRHCDPLPLHFVSAVGLGTATAAPPAPARATPRRRARGAGDARLTLHEAIRGMSIAVLVHFPAKRDIVLNRRGGERRIEFAGL